MSRFIPRIWILFLFLSCSSDDSSDGSDLSPTDGTPDTQTLYFPPLDGSDTWEMSNVSDLDWNENEVQPLIDFLEEKNSRSFILLHQGKIVLEHYMNGHSENSPWYWASAGKTLTTSVVGIAQNEGLIHIDDKVSDYLGIGWTSAPLEKEQLITCKNLLSMDSGLDDSLGDNVAPENLQYITDAGERWAYHNVYVKLQDVVANASSMTWSNYFTTSLKSKIGMSGSWIQNGDFSVYWSNTRSMARFGLLISANGKWESDQIIPSEFLTDAVNTSQSLNESYGYLWWLNGKSSYRLPQTQIEFPGALIPNAPDDMYCALGRDDQKIYIVPSKDLVIVRMGQPADDVNFALSTFDNDLWAQLNLLIN